MSSENTAVKEPKIGLAKKHIDTPTLDIKVLLYCKIFFGLYILYNTYNTYIYAFFIMVSKLWNIIVFCIVNIVNIINLVVYYSDKFAN
jgi:hypothetical protein